MALLVAVLFMGQHCLSQDFSLDGIGYTITSVSVDSFTVAVQGLDPTLTGVVRIPSSVMYKNRIFEVTRIKSAKGSEKVESVILPESITTIEDDAFRGLNIQSQTIPNSVTEIGEDTFSFCRELESIRMSNNVSTLKEGLFMYCSKLAEVDWSPIWEGTIESSVFFYCDSLRTIKIPAGVNFHQTSRDTGSWAVEDGGSIDYSYANVFDFCENVDSLIVEDWLYPISFIDGGDEGWYAHSEFSKSRIKYLYLGRAVRNCSPNFKYVEKLVIGDLVTEMFYWPPSLKQLEIGVSLPIINHDFSKDNALEYIKLKSQIPPTATDFSIWNYMNTILYVPTGTKSIYEESPIWENFWNIEEYEVGTVDAVGQKCEPPTISYENGELAFDCDTDGVTYQVQIANEDIKSYKDIIDMIQLGVTYNISVYATQSGCFNSDVVTATLCWVDEVPKTEGVSSEVAEVVALPVLIIAHDGQINISGANKGMEVYVYNLSGQQIGYDNIRDGRASIATKLQTGNVAIVKIGSKKVKIMMK